MGGTPLTAPVDPFEEAMKRKRIQEGIAQAAGGAAPTSEDPVQTLEQQPPAAVAEPAVDHLSVAKLKQGIGAALTPEEEAALAAEQLQVPPVQTPQPAGGDQGYLARFMQMLGMGG